MEGRKMDGRRWTEEDGRKKMERSLNMGGKSDERNTVNDRVDAHSLLKALQLIDVQVKLRF